MVSHKRNKNWARLFHLPWV